MQVRQEHARLLPFFALHSDSPRSSDRLPNPHTPTKTQLAFLPTFRVGVGRGGKGKAGRRHQISVSPPCCQTIMHKYITHTQTFITQTYSARKKTRKNKAYEWLSSPLEVSCPPFSRSSSCRFLLFFGPPCSSSSPRSKCLNCRLSSLPLYRY